MAIDYGLAGRTVLITGAASGIGLAIAQAFAVQGCRTLLVDRDSTGLAAALQSMQPHNASAFTFDLCSDTEVRALVSMLPHVDVLINNAGVEYPTPLSGADTFADAFSRLLDNNVTSMARLTNALLPSIPDGGCVINQSSIWGRIGVPGFSAYVASKHAVIGLTRALAWELGARSIRVNAVCPGWVFTAAAERSLRAISAGEGSENGEDRDGSHLAAARRAVLARQAIATEITPHDIARSFLFLASDDARAITGQALTVSRGEVMA